MEGGWVKGGWAHKQMDVWTRRWIYQVCYFKKTLTWSCFHLLDLVPFVWGPLYQLEYMKIRYKISKVDLFFMVLEVEPKALCILDKLFTPELHP